MKKSILVAGVGALGSLLTKSLASDVRDEHTITVLDFDKVEERNVRANTQAYTSEMIGLPKTEALQFILHKMNRKINIINREIMDEYDAKLIVSPLILRKELDSPAYNEDTDSFDLVIDCLDNFEARSAITEACTHIPCVHLGFGKNFTWSILWNEGYEPPETAVDWDICEMENAASFVRFVASIGSLVIQNYLKTGKQREFNGNKFSIREII